MMKMITSDSVDKNIFNSIISLLESAKERDNDELKYMNEIHNRVVDTNNNIIRIKDNKSVHYSNKNTVLYNQLQELFGNFNLVLDCFYKLKYNVGDCSHPHKDTYSEQTSLLLLSDNFTGGNFTLDDNNINFNKKGMFVNFDSTKRHSVSELLTGHRDVLVMLFEKNKKIIKKRYDKDND